MASDLVQVSPQERIRRNSGESDAAVRRRWATERKALDAKIARNESDKRWADKRSKATGVSAKTGYDIARAMGQEFAKGGSVKNSGCSVKAYGDMIKKAAGGKVQTSSDTARKLATEMGGMNMGGKPVKKARGGAGKVRKGMMSPSGNILQVVKPKKNMM
jgi:hypothetical protein